MLNDALNDALFFHELQNGDVMLLQEAVSLNNKCVEGKLDNLKRQDWSTVWLNYYKKCC